MPKEFKIDSSKSMGGRHLGEVDARYFIGKDFLDLEVDEIGEPIVDDRGRPKSKSGARLLINLGKTVQVLHSTRGGNSSPVNIEPGDLFVSTHYRELDEMFFLNRQDNAWCQDYSASRTNKKYIQHARGYITCIGNIVDSERKTRRQANAEKKSLQSKAGPGPGAEKKSGEDKSKQEPQKSS